MYALVLVYALVLARANARCNMAPVNTQNGQNAEDAAIACGRSTVGEAACMAAACLVGMACVAAALLLMSAKAIRAAVAAALSSRRRHIR